MVEQLDEVADVQARRGRVEAAVERDRPGGERRAQRVLVGGLGDQPAPAQLVEDVGHGRSLRRVGSRPGARRRPTSACPIRWRCAGRRRFRRPVRRDGRLVVEPEPPRVRRGVAAGAARPRPAGRLRGSAASTGLRPRSQRGSPTAAARTGRRRCRRRSSAERDGQPGRAAGQVAVRSRRRGRRAPARSTPPTTSPARSRTAVGRPGRPADDVGAPVHAVGEVDVEVAGRAVHHRVARRAARGRRASPGRSSPSYASTSVSRTVTGPGGRSTTSRQPSSSGATSSEDRAKKVRPSRIARSNQIRPHGSSAEPLQRSRIRVGGPVSVDARSSTG